MGRTRATGDRVARSDTAARLGGLVRQARLARGWGQEVLAERAGYALATIRRIENGSVGAPLGTWLRVFETLEMLGLLDAIEDPCVRALLDAKPRRRARRAPGG